VGGGKVAVRKIEALLPCGADVLVISPAAEKRIVDFSKRDLLRWEKRPYRNGDLQGAMLVFAATDNGPVQAAVIAEANDLKIPVNVVTRPESCTFHVPASMQRGDLLITAATGGASPALAARIRRELEEKYGTEYEYLLILMAAVRKAVLEQGGTQKEHKVIFERILDSGIKDQIREKRWDDIEDVLRTILPPSCDLPVLLASIEH
jgi:precorrin-2 dehydrogenase/sirohydrochlorin ferrochelatase